MPIQFRCLHCRQLLGISQSRAGSQVDCPACGRSLHVPLQDGGVARTVREHRSLPDARFLNALEELAGLTGQTPVNQMPTNPGSTDLARQVQGTHRPQPSRARGPVEQITPDSQPVTRKRDSLRIVPLSSTSSPQGPVADLHDSSNALPPEIIFEEAVAFQRPAVDSLPEQTKAASAPAPLRPEKRQNSNLPVDAATASNTWEESQFDQSNLSDTLIEITKLDSRTTLANLETDAGKIRHHTGSFLHRIVRATAFTAFAGACFAAGYLVSEFQPSRPPSGNVTESGNQEQTVHKQQMDPTPQHRDAVEILTGKVTYVADTGEQKPDSNSLILLLPEVNRSGLKLDSKPLRDLERTAAQAAIELALNSLGVSFVRANEAGEFSLPRRTTTAAKLVVISRHKSRSTDESPELHKMTELSNWLENPGLLTGRLSSQTRPLSEFAEGSLVPPMEIQFDK